MVRLRDGSKAEIYKIREDEIHGAIYVPSNNRWAADTWALNGMYYKCGELTRHDILGPWIERPDASKLWPLLPPWIKYLAMDKDGVWYGHDKKPGLGGCAWLICEPRHRQIYVCIPPDYNPTFDGDWKDSLIERPE